MSKYVCTLRNKGYEVDLLCIMRRGEGGYMKFERISCICSASKRLHKYLKDPITTMHIFFAIGTVTFRKTPI